MLVCCNFTAQISSVLNNAENNYLYILFFHFSNFTAQSSSLTSLASTLSEGLNEATKRSPNHNRSENLKSPSLKTSNHESSAQFFLIFP